MLKNGLLLAGCSRLTSQQQQRNLYYNGVAGNIILLENCSLVTLLTWKHFFLQDFLVHLGIDSSSLR